MQTTLSPISAVRTGWKAVTLPIRGAIYMWRTIRSDIDSVYERDPAARSTAEILTCYAGLHAIWGHRLTHWLWHNDMPFLARWLAQVMRLFTGIEIHPGATIGPRFFIDHGMGVVIGETAEIGSDVTLYHGVTLGGTSLNKGKRHPTVGDRVVVGAGAKVLGNIEIGPDTRIGANAVVVKSVPENSVVVGVPGQNIARSVPHKVSDKLDLNHGTMPDPLGVSLGVLLQRVEALENLIHSHDTSTPHIQPPEAGLWHGEDFSI
jgi:serine O-acetyltransferase